MAGGHQHTDTACLVHSPAKCPYLESVAGRALGLVVAALLAFELVANIRQAVAVEDTSLAGCQQEAVAAEP